MPSNSQAQVLSRTKAAARYLKQLPDEAAAGLLSELATPLQAFELPVMNLAKIDWDSINVSLQRIEFFHVLRTGVKNQRVDQMLIKLSELHPTLPSWVQSVFHLSERASALLARQRGIVLDSFNPRFRPPRHLLPPLECLRAAVEADKEFTEIQRPSSSSQGHLVEASTSKSRKSCVSTRRQSQVSFRSQAPLHITRHRLAQRNLETSASSISDFGEADPEQAARRKSIDSVSAWLDEQASIEAEDRQAAESNMSSGSPTNSSFRASSHLAEVVHKPTEPGTQPPTVTCACAASLVQHPTVTCDAVKLALTAAAASSFSAAASMTFLMCAQRSWQ